MAKSKAETNNHVAAIQLRAEGYGNLRLKLFSYRQIKSATLVPLIMSASTDIEPTKLTNFKSQRMQIEFRVIDFNEYFVISRLIPYIKPVATSLPQ
jgi:hypothetical protein